MHQNLTPHAYTHTQLLYGGLCMKGNIYTSQKCHICGAALRNDENRDGCFCLVHPDVRAHGPVRVRFGSLRRRFQNYELARRMLTEWRSLSDRNEFNVRDWEAANPRGFRTLSYRWLETKKSVSKRYHQNLTNYIGKAVEEWKDRNVKTIQYGEIEDFILSLDVSDKPRHNTLEGLKQFFRWAAKRERIPIPEFPEIEFTLGWREIIDTETQSAIINEVERIAQIGRAHV